MESKALSENSSPWSDVECIQRVAAGENRALALLIERWQPVLERYILRRCYSCKAELDDLMQDVFLRVFSYANAYDPGMSFSAWIYRMTHNLMVSRIRRHAVRGEEQHFDEALFPSHLFRTDGQLEQQELQRGIAVILEQMPEKFRDVFVLRHFEEKDYEEISDVLRLNVNTVATRIRRSNQFFVRQAKSMGLEPVWEDA